MKVKEYKVRSYPTASGDELLCDVAEESAAQQIAGAMNGFPMALIILKAVKRTYEQNENRPGRKSWQAIARGLAGLAQTAVSELEGGAQ